MHYLATTDEEAASLLANMERAEYRAKATRDIEFRHAEGTVAERAAIAGCASSYTDAMNEYFAAVQAFHSVKNKRQTEALVVDVWRSMESSRRQGNIQ
jgi:hypothetical protein